MMYNLTKTLRNLSWKEVRRFQKVTQLNTFREVSSGSANQTTKDIQANPTHSRKYIKRGPGLEYFLVNGSQNDATQTQGDVYLKEKHPYISDKSVDGTGKKGNIVICITKTVTI